MSLSSTSASEDDVGRFRGSSIGGGDVEWKARGVYGMAGGWLSSGMPLVGEGWGACIPDARRRVLCIHSTAHISFSWCIPCHSIEVKVTILSVIHFYTLAR